MDVLEKMNAELASIDKQKGDLDKKRAQVLADIVKYKLSMESTYLNLISQIVGEEVKIQQSSACSDIKCGNINVATFHLQQLQGCCGVCVSYHSSVNSKFRNKGLGTLLNKMRQQIAWDNGYTVLLCTDVESNQAQQKILTTNGWEKLMTFTNRRTRNKVCIHTIQLKDTGMKVGDKFLEVQKD